MRANFIVEKIKNVFRPKSKSILKSYPRLEDGFARLENLHWLRKDRKPGHEDEAVEAWTAILQALLNSDSAAEEFVRRRGLTWVHWYVVEKQLIFSSPTLAALIRQIVNKLSHGRLMDGHGFLRKKKEKQCFQEILGGLDSFYL